MKILKEDLLKEVAMLREKLDRVNSMEANRREEISKFLNAPKVRRMGGMYEDDKVFSWGEIYFELGKLQASLLQVENVNYLMDRVREISMEVANLQDLKGGDSK